MLSSGGEGFSGKNIGKKCLQAVLDSSMVLTSVSYTMLHKLYHVTHDLFNVVLLLSDKCHLLLWQTEDAKFT